MRRNYETTPARRQAGSMLRRQMPTSVVEERSAEEGKALHSAIKPMTENYTRLQFRFSSGRRQS
jgi:hypothetical protein